MHVEFTKAIYLGGKDMYKSPKIIGKDEATFDHSFFYVKTRYLSHNSLEP